MTTRQGISTGELDVASIEADIILAYDEQANAYDVDAVTHVTGVLLASSAEETPGFASAGIVATITELNATQETAMPATISTPSDFSRSQLLADPAVRALINEESQTLRDQVTNLKTDVEKSTAKVKELETNNQKLAGDLKKAGGAALLPKISALVEAKVKALKASDAEKAVITAHLKARTFGDDPLVADTDLEKAVDQAVAAEYATVEGFRKLYGKSADAGSTGPKDEGTPADGAGDGKERPIVTPEEDKGDPFLESNPAPKKS